LLLVSPKVKKKKKLRLGLYNKKRKGEMKNGQVSYGRVEPTSLKRRDEK
jgi:hypothetical protein